MNPLIYAWLIPGIPLVLTPIPILAGRRLERGSGYIAIGSIAFSTLFSVYLLIRPPLTPAFQSVTWIAFGTGRLSVGIYVDHLSILMSVVTSGISLLIQVYSLEYMRHEEGLPRYWTEMMLFTGSMLGFALAGTLITMYVFWELVGVCSYLLIGFWYTRPEAAAAAKKAFVVTRVGDVGFLVGIVLLYLNAHTLSLAQVINQPINAVVSPQMRTAISLLVFFAATGKSAQIPLFTWLPDAMEGPTTVSALIHSATMVAAGVYLVARLYPFFLVSPYALEVVALIGSASAFVAATMALVSFDLKRILAYSTMSQLGYMMAGLGVGAFSGSVFHLLNHAVFKSMLFLSAGAVLHVLDTRDIREMGGLLRRMKVTSLAFLVGALSLSGIPPLNGFFSKDDIVGAAFSYGVSTGDYVVYILTLGAAAITAFYIFRAFFIAYVLPPRVSRDREAKEVPLVMTLPMVILIALTFITGWLWSPLGDFFQPYVRYSPLLPFESEPALYLIVVSVGFALLGIGLSYITYVRRTIDPEEVNSNTLGSALRTLFSKGYYFDDAYDAVAKAVSYVIAGGIDYFDRCVLDGAVNGIARLVTEAGEKVRITETGRVRNYAAAVLVGIVILLILFVVI